MLNRIFLFLILAVSLACQAQTKNVKLLSPAEFKQAISKGGVQLIDVRTLEEYQAGHIKNAQHIDYFAADFKERVAKLDRKKPIYLYCQSGGRSGKASAILSELGFTAIYDLKGGYGKWVD